MKIGIEINGVLRDTLKKVQQEYEKWYELQINVL